MKNWIRAVGVTVALLLISNGYLVTSAYAANTLHEFYTENVGFFPSLDQRGIDALTCGIVTDASHYVGSTIQNIKLKKCLENEFNELALGGLVTKPNDFSPGTVIRSADVNANFDTLYTLVNGNISNSNINASAAITNTKINGTAIVSTGEATQSITSDVTVNGSLIVSSTADYFRVPLMTTAQKTALGAVDNGALVYDTTLGQFSIREGGSWAAISPAAATAVASATGKGIVEIATGTNAASSTPAGTGDTNAPLVIDTSITTSSPYTTGKFVPVTENDGKLNQLFLDLTDTYTWTGLHIFSGGLRASGDVNVSSTNATSNIRMDSLSITSSTATTTINGGIVVKGVNANPLFLGTTSNADALHTHQKLYNFVSSTNGARTLDNSDVETDLLNTTLPANSLGNNGFVRVRLYVSNFKLATTGDDQFIGRIYLGSTNIASFGLVDTNGVNASRGFIEFTIMNKSATNAQSTVGIINVTEDSATGVGATSEDFAVGDGTEDTTTALTLRFSADFNTAEPNNSITVSHSTVEVVPSIP